MFNTIKLSKPRLLITKNKGIKDLSKCLPSIYTSISPFYYKMGGNPKEILH